MPESRPHRGARSTVSSKSYLFLLCFQKHSRLATMSGLFFFRIIKVHGEFAPQGMKKSRCIGGPRRPHFGISNFGASGTAAVIRETHFFTTSPAVGKSRNGMIPQASVERHYHDGWSRIQMSSRSDRNSHIELRNPTALRPGRRDVVRQLSDFGCCRGEVARTCPQVRRSSRVI